MGSKKIEKNINDAIKINATLNTSIISGQKKYAKNRNIVKSPLSVDEFIKIVREGAEKPSFAPPEDTDDRKQQ